MYPAGSATPVELAHYGFAVDAGDDGSVYYTWDDDTESHLVKLGPA